ncbi:MAG: hypothetical protein WCI27_02705 [Candidatus Omnitrophota bacterium]
MKKFTAGIGMLGVIMFAAAGSAGAAVTGAVNTPAGQVSAQVILDPKAQEIIDQSKLSGTAAQQESFLVTRAKALMGEGKYEAAVNLANYILTTLNAKSAGAQDILTTAKQKIADMARQKLAGVLTSSTPAATGTLTPAQQKAAAAREKADKVAGHVQGILGAFGK